MVTEDFSTSGQVPEKIFIKPKDSKGVFSVKIDKVTTFLQNSIPLLTPTEPYVFADHAYSETEQIAKDMIALMYKSNGIGLSANQCGLPWSIFVMRGMPADFACFNPKVVMPSEELVKLEEACLSFPGLVIPMMRSKHLRMRFAGPNGEISSHTFTGMTARVIQHEMCHIEGRMFFEGCSRIHLDRAIRQAKKNGFDYSSSGLMKYTKR